MKEARRRCQRHRQQRHWGEERERFSTRKQRLQQREEKKEELRREEELGEGDMEVFSEMSIVMIERDGWRIRQQQRHHAQEEPQKWENGELSTSGVRINICSVVSVV